MAAKTPVPGCPRHPGMRLLFVCKSCEDQLLCSECITDGHNGHTMGKLTEYVVDQQETIRQYVELMPTASISKVAGDIKDQQAKTHGGRYQKMTEDIKCQGTLMKYTIDKTIAVILEVCTELQERDSETSEKNKSTLTKYLMEVCQQLDKCQEILTSGTTVDVTTLAQEIRNGVSTVQQTLSALKNVEYKPRTISTELLERMLGKLVVDGVESCKPIPKCEILYEFQTPVPYTTCQTCLTGEEAWLSYFYTDTIYRVDLKGNVSERIKLKVKVASISVSPTTGRLWFCVYGDRSIREITTGGDIVTRFHVDNTPYSLCITVDDLVVVGMAGGIQLYTTDGRAVSTGVGGPCRQVAVTPHHMTSCTLTGDVAAVDSDGVKFNDYMACKKPGKQPSVIVMDKHLNLKFYCKDIGTGETRK